MDKEERLNRFIESHPDHVVNVPTPSLDPTFKGMVQRIKNEAIAEAIARIRSSSYQPYAPTAAVKMRHHYHGSRNAKAIEKKAKVQLRVIERMERIVLAREQGKTYNEIASVEGISRERVRQLLKSVAPDLMGYRNRHARPLVTVECTWCKTPLQRKMRKHPSRRYFCGPDCPKKPTAEEMREIKRLRTRARYYDPVTGPKLRAAIDAWNKKARKTEKYRAYSREYMREYHKRKRQDPEWVKKKREQQRARYERYRQTAEGREKIRAWNQRANARKAEKNLLAQSEKMKNELRSVGLWK